MAADLRGDEHDLLHRLRDLLELDDRLLELLPLLEPPNRVCRAIGIGETSIRHLAPKP